MDDVKKLFIEKTGRKLPDCIGRYDDDIYAFLIDDVPSNTTVILLNMKTKQIKHVSFLEDPIGFSKAFRNGS